MKIPSAVRLVAFSIFVFECSSKAVIVYARFSLITAAAVAATTAARWLEKPRKRREAREEQKAKRARKKEREKREYGKRSVRDV